MNALLKYSGLLLQLIGVALLLIPKAMGNISNGYLVSGGTLIVLGIIVYVIINRVVKK